MFRSRTINGVSSWEGFTISPLCWSSSLSPLKSCSFKLRGLHGGLQVEERIGRNNTLLCAFQSCAQISREDF